MEKRELLAVGVTFAGGVLGLTGNAGVPDDVAVVANASPASLNIYVGGALQTTLTGVGPGGVNTINFDGKTAGLGSDSLSVKNVTTFTVNLTDVENLAIPSGTNATVTSTPAGFAFGNVSLGGTLTLNASAGPVTDAPGTAMVVAGLTTVNVGAGTSVTLDNPTNNFSAVNVTAVNNLSLVDSTGIVLGPSTVSGALTVTAKGSITQTGAISVVGATTLTAVSYEVKLDNALNDFSTVAVTKAWKATLADVNAVDLGASTLTGTLAVTANGGAGITQSGALTVAGATTMTALGATNDIVLGLVNDFYSFGGNGRNVTVNDANKLILGASVVTGTLNVTANGLLSQNGLLNVTLGTTLSAGAANSIVLSSANQFSSVSVLSGRDVTLRDVNALVLDACTVSNNLAVTAGGAITDSVASTVAGRITLAAAGNPITLDGDGVTFSNFNQVAVTAAASATINDVDAMVFATSNVAGPLTVTAGGDVTQVGSLTVAGIAKFTVVGNDVILTNAANNFSSTAPTGVEVTADAISLRDANAIALRTCTATDTLSVTATGAITQNGPLTVTNATTLTCNNAITLANPTNDFSSLGITCTGSAAIADINALVLNDCNVSGVFGVTTFGGNISQAAAPSKLIVSGAATFNAGLADVVLGNVGNNFASVGVNANNATLRDVTWIVLNASNVANDLTVTAAGNITQSAALSVARGAILNAGAADIVLTNAGNDFSSGGTAADGVFAIGRHVSLRDAGAMALNTSAASGNLTVTTNGGLTQNGAVTVAALTTLADASANPITLGNALNDFFRVKVTSGGNVTLTDANAIVLATSSITGAGTLNVNTSGNITQDGTVSVVGATTLAAGAGNVTLNYANNFSSVGVTTTGSVVLRDANALTLAASTIGGTLSVTAAGLLDQSGVLNVTGATTLSVGGTNDINLASANLFSSVGITSARDVAITDANALTLAASTVSRDYTVVTTGAIGQSGAVKVAGMLSLDVGAATNNIALGSTSNDLRYVSVVQALDVTLGDANDIDLNACTISGNLVVNAGVSITDSNVVSVTGATTLTAGADITLDVATSTYSAAALISLTGRNAYVVNNTTTHLGVCTTTANLTVICTGFNLDNGGGNILTVAGVATLNPGGANSLTINNYSLCTFTGGLVTDAGTVNLIG